MKKISFGALLAVSLVAADSAHGFSLRRVAFSGGAVAASGGSYTLGATVAEAGVVGRVGGGSYTLGQGFWPNVIAITATDVPGAGGSAAAWVNRLRPNFPNPFGASTAIGYSVAQSANVRLTVYDVAGRRVSSLVDVNQEPGRYRVQWHGRDDSGRAVASGVYLYRLDVGDWSQTRKMLKIR